MKQYLKSILLVLVSPIIIGSWMIFNMDKVWAQAKKEWFGGSKP